NPGENPLVGQGHGKSDRPERVLRAVRAFCDEDRDRRSAAGLLRPVKGGGSPPLRELDRCRILCKDNMAVSEPFHHHVQVPDTEGFYRAGRDHNSLSVIPGAVTPCRGATVAGQHLAREVELCRTVSDLPEAAADVLCLGRILAGM